MLAPRTRRLVQLAGTLLCAIFVLGVTGHAIEYPTRTKGSTTVRIYEQRLMPETSGGVSGGPGHVIAKYSDLIQKAIAYKQQYPAESVEIRFATYRMSHYVYVGFDPSQASYLGVSNTDFAGDHSEKLIWSFCKAAQAGVTVKLILHKPGEANVSLTDLTDYLDLHGGPNLQYQVVNWGEASDDQMHNKFLLVNRTRVGSTDYHSILYTTSANVDEWRAYGPRSSKNWQQTGVLTYQNAGVYNAYRRYFDAALWPHAGDTNAAAFRNTMNALHHASGGLNYAEDADGISAYFYPVSDADYWTPAYNPHARVLGVINNTPGVTEPFVKMNQAYLRFHHANWIEFGETYMDQVRTMASIHGIDLSDPSVANARVVAWDHDATGGELNPIAANRIALGPRTHSKNMAYAFTLNGVAQYYSSGGSTNAKYNDFARKANNIIMIREVGSANREVYQDFYEAFNYIFAQ